MLNPSTCPSTRVQRSQVAISSRIPSHCQRRDLHGPLHAQGTGVGLGRARAGRHPGGATCVSGARDEAGIGAAPPTPARLLFCGQMASAPPSRLYQLHRPSSSPVRGVPRLPRAARSNWPGSHLIRSRDRCTSGDCPTGFRGREPCRRRPSRTSWRWKVARSPDPLDRPDRSLR